MVALTQAELTGEGEHIDVSMQECVVLAMENAVQFYDLEKTVRKRWAGDQRFAGTGVYACSDGHVFLMAGGIGANRFWERTLKWFVEEGMDGVEEFRQPHWQDVKFLESSEAKKLFSSLFLPWAASRTKAQLYHAGQARQIPIAPVNTPADIIYNPQLLSRGHFVDVPQAMEGRALRMPGAPYKLSETPWCIQRPAPRLGQHNQEVWEELRATATSSTLPLAGIRVADFCWLGAGSYCTKLLADMGADVIKIESSARLDSLRLAPPYKDGISGINRSGYFADRNTSKRSITIDMKHPKALGLVSRLIERSDIVSNNFTPGVMEKFGLGYESVRKMRPDIVYLAMSMQGSEGPERSYLGYGASMVSLTGLHDLSGLPEREPAGTGTNYPDHIPNPCHA
eukprot:gene18373-37278_t